MMADNRITIQAEFGQNYKDLGFIGRVGENDSREIVFDCADALTQFPGASIVCVIKRACDTKPYSAPLTDEGYNRILPLSAVENAVAGQIMIELRAVSNDTILKSAMFSGRISESLQGEGDAPGAPVRDVLDRAESVLEEAKSARDKLDALINTIQSKLDNGELNGADGSDATVTAESVETALGYKPIKDVQIAGSSVLDGGVASIPMAAGGKPGVTYCYGPSVGGLYIASDGAMRIIAAPTTDIDTRETAPRPITGNNLDYAVKAAMCDGKGAAWTSAEQQAARERMGLDKPWELIEEITLAEDIVLINRDDLDLKRLMIFGKIPKAAAAFVTEIYSGSTFIGYWYAFGAIATDYPKQIRISCEATEVGFITGGCVGNSQSASQKVMPYNWLSTTGHIQAPGNITKISMYASSTSAPIPVSTKIQIYGVRA